MIVEKSAISASAVAKSRRNWKAVAQRLAQAEPEYISDDSFASRRAEAEIIGDLPAALAETPAFAAWKEIREMPAHLARLCESALLQPTEEAHLFRRMNYAKYRADRLRRKLAANKPDRELIARVEMLLALAAQDRDRIIQANLRLVLSIAKKFADPARPFDDLVSEGVISLLRAVEKFDYSRGFRFSTYATLAITRTLCRSLKSLQRDQQRFVTSEPDVLDATADDEQAGTMTVARWTELRAALARMMKKLDPRERRIIRRRFGLEKSRDAQTLQSLAREFGVCKERVRQLETRAMSKLRTLAAEVRLQPPEET